MSVLLSPVCATEVCIHPIDLICLWKKEEERYEAIERINHASGASAALRLILVRRPFHNLFLIYQSVTHAMGHYQWFIVFLWFLTGDDYIVGTSDAI
jgi:hypothetical protein